MPLRSGYDSSVCCDRVIDDVLLVDWIPVPVGGLVGRGNSPAPYFVVLLKPGFLARSSSHASVNVLGQPPSLL